MKANNSTMWKRRLASQTDLFRFGFGSVLGFGQCRQGLFSSKSRTLPILILAILLWALGFRVYGLGFTVLLMIALIPTSGLLCRKPQDPRNSLRNKVLMSMSGPVPRAQMYQVIPAQNTFWKTLRRRPQLILEAAMSIG